MRTIKFRAWITVDVDDTDEDIKSMTYDLAFTKYAPINELLSKQEDLMQFTGIKDKNGKDIYEGDIVKPYSIEKTKNLSIIVYEFNQFRIKGAFLYWNWDLKQVEVVGNIYENPELTPVILKFNKNEEVPLNRAISECN